MPIDYDPIRFYEELVRHGHIYPVGVEGAFGRGATFEDVLDRFNDLVSDIASNDGAETRTFPPVVARKVIERNNYLESFWENVVKIPKHQRLKQLLTNNSKNK